MTRRADKELPAAWARSQQRNVPRERLVYFMAGLGIWALHGLFVDFLPADPLLGQGMVIAAVVLAVIGMSIFIRFWWAAAAHDDRPPVLWKALLSFPVVFLMLGCMMFLILAKSIPWSFTLVFGSPARIEASMHTRHKRARRNCDYTLRGSVLNIGSAALCIPKRLYLAHPDRQVKATLVGRTSVLGFVIEDISVRDARSPAKE